MDYGVGTRNTKFAPLAVKQGNFDYNDRIEVDVAQKHYHDFWIQPLGGVVNQSGPFTFTIDPMPDKYIQLNRARLEMICRLVSEDNDDLDPCLDIAAPINLLGPCMWENVEIFLNGQPFTGASSTNAGYKAYIETMLSYDQDASKTHLHSQFYELDSPGEYDTMKVSDKLLRENFLNAIRQGKAAGPAIPNAIARNPAVALPPELDFDDNLILMIDPDEAERIVNQTETILDTDSAHVQQTKLEKDNKRRRMRLYIEHFEVQAALTRRILLLPSKSKGNIGFNERFKIVNGSVPFDMYSPITHDFFPSQQSYCTRKQN